MKNFMIKHGMILVLSLMILVVFVIGGMYSNYMTNQIDVHVQERYEQAIIQMIEKGNSIEKFEPASVNKEYIAASTGESYQPKLIDAFKVLDSQKRAIAYVYVIETIGNSEGLKIAYAIDPSTDRLINIQVITHNETVSVEGQYYLKLNDRYFRRFENKDLDVIDFKVDTISGATYTTQAFDVGMKYARELYAADTDFEIITVLLEINSLSYNYDLLTVNEYPFIAEITFGLENNTAVIGLNNTFNYVSTISGTDPTTSEIEAMRQFVTTANLINTNVKIQSFDDENDVLRVSVSGFSSTGVTIDIQLNASLDTVLDIVFVSTSESYEYGDGYVGSPAPAVENDFINEYNASGNIIDSVAGATVTSNALIRLLQWVENLETELNGGN